MSIIGLLTGPIANPFRIRHDKKKPVTRQGVSNGYHLTWEKQTLPDAGAGQYSWETYGLPPTAPYGFGNINVQNPSRETQPAAYVFQSVGIVGNPPSSIVQGQFTTQPLMDASMAVAQGIVTPGAVQPSPNAINSTMSPVLTG